MLGEGPCIVVDPQKIDRSLHDIHIISLHLGMKKRQPLPQRFGKRTLEDRIEKEPVDCLVYRFHCKIVLLRILQRVDRHKVEGNSDLCLSICRPDCTHSLAMR